MIVDNKSPELVGLDTTQRFGIMTHKEILKAKNASKGAYHTLLEKEHLFRFQLVEDGNRWLLISYGDDSVYDLCNVAKMPKSAALEIFKVRVKAFLSGFDTGYKSGNENAKKTGIENHYKKGYDEGYQAGQDIYKLRFQTALKEKMDRHLLQ